MNENIFEECVKCTICTTVCPMMEVNPFYPGPKQAGPDGRRFRLKDPGYFDLTLKFCLDCRRCEVACPSGVKVGDLIQLARIRYGRQSNPVRDRILASPDFAGSVATSVSSAANSLLSSRPVKAVLHTLAGIDRHRALPKYSPVRFRDWFKQQDQDGFSKFVNYFHGCYVNYNFPQLGKDLVRILNACGYGVRLLEKEKCCGAANISNGFGRRAERQAAVNVASIRKATASGEPVLTTGTTCTSTIRDEYSNVLGLDMRGIRDSVLLATKWLYERIEEGSVRLAFKEGLGKRISYHTSCHMSRLGWGLYSISLLKMIPGAVVSVPEQQCCGMAGTFGFKRENYPYSQMIGSGLFKALESEKPDVVATDCETCKWQIESGTGLKVMNPISIIAEALDIERTKELNG